MYLNIMFYCKFLLVIVIKRNINRQGIFNIRYNVKPKYIKNHT